GGDNSNGSQGTFYEGAMTAAGTFPTQDLNQKVQANIVAAKYDEPRLTLAPAGAVNPPGLQTFSLGSSPNTTVTFKNTTGMEVTELKLTISTPKGWPSAANDSSPISSPLAPGATVSATFKVTSTPSPFNGDLMGRVSWKSPISGVTQSET